MEIICCIEFSENFKNSDIELFKCGLAQILKPIQIDVSLLVVLIGFKEFNSMLDFLEDFVELGRILYSLVMIENIGALVLIFVVLLMLLNLTDHAC